MDLAAVLPTLIAVVVMFSAGADLDEERHLVATPTDSLLLVQIMPLDDDDEPDWSGAAVLLAAGITWIAL